MIILFLFSILYSLFSIHSLSTVFPADESVVVRNQLNQAALKMFTHSPIFGVGLGNFLVRLPDYLVSRQIYFLQPVHNIYLLLLSEAGVIGIIILVFIGFMLLKHEAGSMKQEIKINHMSFMIHTSLFTLLFLGLFDHYSLTLQQGQLLFVLIAGLNWII